MPDGFDFVTSDTHFGHEYILKCDNAPFATIEEHDEAIIENWNSKVKDRHKHVWHLGDFAFRNKKPIEWYTRRLFGQIHVVLGNHDGKGVEKNRSLFASVHDVKYLRIDGQKMTLSHYAQRTWRCASYGAWMLYGHSHGKLAPFGRSFDVGTMVHNYTPLSFRDVGDIMADLEVKCPDHCKFSELVCDD